jgi:hypothetical protein
VSACDRFSSGQRGLRQERHAWEGITGAAAGTSAGGTRDAAGALDASWTVWMWRNRAPRLAVNAYNRYLISSRENELAEATCLLHEASTA